MWQDGAASKALSIVPVQPTNRGGGSACLSESVLEPCTVWDWKSCYVGLNYSQNPDLSHGELDKHKFKKPGGIVIRNVAKWRTAGAIAVSFFQPHLFFCNSWQRFSKEKPKREKKNPRKRETSVECLLKNSTFWRGFVFKERSSWFLFLFPDLKDAISMIKQFGIWDF